jgi:hypothetical protein
LQNGFSRIGEALRGLKDAFIGKNGLLDALGSFGQKLRELGNSDSTEWIERPIRGAIRLIHVLERITRALAALGRGDVEGAVEELLGPGPRGDSAGQSVGPSPNDAAGPVNTALRQGDLVPIYRRHSVALAV